jgi:hypothetical protein
MHNITARDIQAFIGGALALAGFNGLVQSAAYLSSGRHLAADLISVFIAAIPFAIGVGVLLGHSIARRAMQVFLWVVVAAAVFLLLASALISALISPAKAPFHVPWLGITADAILLALFLWSKSGRFTSSRPNQAMDPTADQ